MIVRGDEMTMMNDDVGSLPLAAHLTTVRTNQDTYRYLPTYLTYL